MAETLAQKIWAQTRMPPHDNLTEGDPLFVQSDDVHQAVRLAVATGSPIDAVVTTLASFLDGGVFEGTPQQVAKELAWALEGRLYRMIRPMLNMN